MFLSDSVHDNIICNYNEMGMLKFVGGLAGNHIWPDDWVFLYGCSDTDQVISRQKLIVNIHTYCLLARLLLDSIFYCYKDGCPTDLNLLLSK